MTSRVPSVSWWPSPPPTPACPRVVRAEDGGPGVLQGLGVDAAETEDHQMAEAFQAVRAEGDLGAGDHLQHQTASSARDLNQVGPDGAGFLKAADADPVPCGPIPVPDRRATGYRGPLGRAQPATERMERHGPQHSYWRLCRPSGWSTPMRPRPRLRPGRTSSRGERADVNSLKEVWSVIDSGSHSTLQ